MAPLEKNANSVVIDDMDDLPELPKPVEEINGNTKTVTSYEYDEDDKMVKVISHYRIERQRVRKAIAERKSLKKYGLSKGDGAGPNAATTILSEEVFMQFVTAHGEEEDENEDKKRKLAEAAKGTVKCRICKEDHWTTRCPYKDELAPLAPEEEPEPSAAATPGASKAPGGKYIPPSQRGGARAAGETMGHGRDDTCSVRISNLSETTKEGDLRDLCERFGDVARVFLCTDRRTGVSKGFAFVNYKRKSDAEACVNGLHGRAYDHVILHVEWAKPSGQ